MISISRTKGRLMRIGDGGAVGGQDGIASCLGRGLGSSSDWREPNSPVKENDERRYHPGDNEHKQETAVVASRGNRTKMQTEVDGGMKENWQPDLAAAFQIKPTQQERSWRKPEKE